MIAMFIGERQRAAPDHLQARVGITGRMMVVGSIAVGSAIVSVLSEVVPLRALYVGMGVAILGRRAGLRPAAARGRSPRRSGREPVRRARRADPPPARDRRRAPGRHDLRGAARRSSSTAASAGRVRPPFGLEHEGAYDAGGGGPAGRRAARPTTAWRRCWCGSAATRSACSRASELVASKVGSRLVHGRHRAGGSSANRFRRRREKEVRELHEKAAQEAWRVLGPGSSASSAAALGGDRAAVRGTIDADAAAGAAGGHRPAALLHGPRPAPGRAGAPAVRPLRRGARGGADRRVGRLPSAAAPS